MLCIRCKKNQATKTKEEVVDGKKTSSYYCADCFRALFLQAADYTDSPSKCPYCGKGKDGVIRSGLVGCSGCYTAFGKELIPLIVKWQGDKTHAGKTAYTTERNARLQTRYDELQVLIRKGTEEQDVEKVKAYSQESQRIKALKEGVRRGDNT